MKKEWNAPEICSVNVANTAYGDMGSDTEDYVYVDNVGDIFSWGDINPS